MQYYIDYNYLLQLLKDNNISNTKLSSKAHISTFKLKQVLDNKAYFSQDEIINIINVLNINSEQVLKCFFNIKETFKTKQELIAYTKDKK